MNDPRKTKKALIQESNSLEYAESIINTVREPLIVLDQDLRVVTASRSFYEFFKVKPEETVGQLIYDLGNRQWDIPKLRELLETILPQKTTFDNYEVEHDFVTIGKRTMLLNARQIKRAFGKERIIVLAIEDITERKQVDETLRNTEARLHTLVQAIPDLIWLKDKDGVYLSCNTMFERLFGAKEAEIVGKTDYDFVNRELADSFRENDLKAMAEGKITSNEEWVTFADDGHRVFLDTIKTLMYNTQGTLIGVLGIGRDITDRASVERIRKALGATVQAIAIMVEERDPYTAGHQRRVADLARSIATEMNLPSDQIDGIRVAASIHDLGKISIPAEILSKPTKLKQTEFDLIKEHSQAGYDILKDIDFPWPVARIVLGHHERMNGSGYPDGLIGDNILLESRIIAIADVVEAMASDRPYRPGLGIDVALAEIEKNKGTHYDNTVADACLRLFREKGYQLP